MIYGIRDQSSNYIRNLHNSTPGRQTINLKNRQNSWTDTSPRGPADGRQTYKHRLSVSMQMGVATVGNSPGFLQKRKNEPVFWPEITLLRKPSFWIHVWKFLEYTHVTVCGIRQSGKKIPYDLTYLWKLINKIETKAQVLGKDCSRQKKGRRNWIKEGDRPNERMYIHSPYTQATVRPWLWGRRGHHVEVWPEGKEEDISNRGNNQRK